MDVKSLCGWTALEGSGFSGLRQRPEDSTHFSVRQAMKLGMHAGTQKITVAAVTRKVKHHAAPSGMLFAQALEKGYLQLHHNSLHVSFRHR